MDSVMKFTKKVLIVTIYLSFMLFPVIFANKVHSAFIVESDNKIDGTVLDQFSIKFEKYIQLTETEFFSQNSENDEYSSIKCLILESKEMIFKASFALVLSALVTFGKVIKI